MMDERTTHCRQFVWRLAESELSAADLDRPVSWPWTEPRPLGMALAWANSEAMKNVAEIGYAR